MSPNRLKKKISEIIKGILSYVKSHKRRLLLILPIFAIILVAMIVVPLFKESPIVSSEGLKDYILEYSAEYRRFVEENMGLLDRGIVEGYSQSGSHNLTFYWNYPKKIHGVISSSHGTAVFFNHSDRKNTEISIKSLSEPIEYYVWPNMPKNTTGLPVVRILKASTCYHLDSKVSYDYGLIYVDPEAKLRYTGEGHVFDISGLGAIAIFGSLIEEDRMILKGSNSKEDWSELQARFDALSEFTWDCRDILNESTIKTLEAKYKLPLMLDKIGTRIERRKYVDNPDLFTADFEELKAIGAPNGTLSKILSDYLNMQENPPLKWYELLCSFCLENIREIAVTVIGTIIGGVCLTIIVKKYIGKESEVAS